MRRWGRVQGKLYGLWAGLLAAAGYRKMIRRAVSALRDAGPVLDVGCGSGEAIAILSRERPGMRVLGCELSPELLARVRVRYPQVRLFAADAEQLAVRSGSCAAALSFGVLAHLPDPAAALQELARTVRSGGMVAVWTRTEGRLSRLIAWLFVRMNPGALLCLHGIAEVRALLAGAGVRLTHEEQIAGGYLWVGICQAA